jgi:tetratricopeptide (TPR) repeat protein
MEEQKFKEWQEISELETSEQGKQQSLKIETAKQDKKLAQWQWIIISALVTIATLYCIGSVNVFWGTVLLFCWCTFFTILALFIPAKLLINRYQSIFKTVTSKISSDALQVTADSELETFIGELATFEEIVPNTRSLKKLVEQKNKNIPAETNYKSLENSYKNDLAQKVKIYGYCHQETASCLNHLAWFYYEQQKYDLAKNIYEKALYILEKTIGFDNKLTESIQSNYQRLQITTGDAVKIQIKPKDL